jgi:iron complex outermembrane receptor protein
MLILLPCFSYLRAQQSFQDTISISEVVITATKNEVSKRNIPLTITSINPEQINQSDESALLPLISEQTPGLFVTERGMLGFGVSTGAAGQISIRGIGGSPTTQVLILIDGHPQFMGIMGHPLPDAYVTSDAEKVEIIRGPGSILYGSNAMGGVINIITRNQKENGYNINARASYGMFNTQKLALSGGMRRNKFSVFGSFNYGHTDGHRDSSDFTITNGYLKTSYHLNKNVSITADVNMADYHVQDPGKVQDSLAGEMMNIFRGETSLSVDNSFSKTEGSLKIYYNMGDHNFTDGWRSHDEMYGLMAYQVLKPFKGNSVTIGYDYMVFGGRGKTITTVLRDENGNIIPGSNGRPQFVISEYNDKWVSANSHAAYAFMQQQLLLKVTLTAGIRYENNSIFGGALIPQAGFAFYPGSNTTLRGSLSKGYRPPSIRELYLFPTANEALKPENILNSEIGWEQKWLKGIFNTSLTLFWLNGDNIIVKNPPVAPPPPLYKNTGNIENKGIEFSTDIRPVKVLTVHANYAYINMKTPMSGTPEHSLFISSQYRIDKFSVSVKINYISNLYGEDAGGLVSVIEDGYLLAGIKLSYKIVKMLELFVSGDNLLNQSYQHIYGYPNPGINITGGINFKFSGK